MGTVLCQSQLAAITYIDSGTCNLDSEVNVELWVNSAPGVCELSNLVVNTATSLTMNKLTLTTLKSPSSILERITSASISAIDNKLDVTATGVITEKLDVTIGDIHYLTAGNFGNEMYLKTDGDIQTTGLRITKEGEQPLILTYELLNKLINLLANPKLINLLA